MNGIYEFIAREFGMKDSVNIVEVGAHIGTDTVRLSKFVGKGKMVAFEPDPRNLPILEKRAMDNCLSIDLTLVEQAVGAKKGKATFHLSSGLPPYEDSHIAETKQHTASSSLKAPKNHLERFPWVKFEETATVNVVTLDDYFKDDKYEIDLLWVDVQGAEIDLVVGGHETLERTKFLFTEFNNDEMYEGQPNFETLMNELHGNWGLVHMFGDEVLLQNKNFGDDWISESHAQECWDARYSNAANLPELQEQGQQLARDFFMQGIMHRHFQEVLMKTKSLLEIGCGTGELAHLAKQMFKYDKIVATDCSKVAVAYASNTYGADAKFNVHDARRPFKYQNFDLAIACNVLQLFKKPFLLLDNMLAASKHCIVIVPYMQPVTDGYNDEGGLGHVFSFTDATFEQYNVISQLHYISKGWQHSAKGEPPIMVAVLMGRK